MLTVCVGHHCVSRPRGVPAAPSPCSCCCIAQPGAHHRTYPERRLIHQGRRFDPTDLTRPQPPESSSTPSPAGHAALHSPQRSVQCATSATRTSAKYPGVRERRAATEPAGQVRARDGWLACCGVSSAGTPMTPAGSPSSSDKRHWGHRHHHPAHRRRSSPSMKTTLSPLSPRTMMREREGRKRARKERKERMRGWDRTGADRYTALQPAHQYSVPLQLL